MNSLREMWIITKGQKYFHWIALAFSSWFHLFRLLLPLVLSLWPSAPRTLQFFFFHPNVACSHFTLLLTCIFSLTSFGKWLTLYLGCLGQTAGNSIFWKGLENILNISTQKKLNEHIVCHHHASYRWQESI